MKWPLAPVADIKDLYCHIESLDFTPYVGDFPEFSRFIRPGSFLRFSSDNIVSDATGSKQPIQE
jgi:hypothetical protein